MEIFLTGFKMLFTEYHIWKIINTIQEKLLDFYFIYNKRTRYGVGVVDTGMTYTFANWRLNPNLLAARQTYRPSSASVTDLKTRGL